MIKYREPSEIFFINNIEEIEVCESKFLEFLGSTFRKPTDFIRELNEDHNLNTCEGCNKNYLIILDRFKKRHEKFPNCCNYHRKLISQVWFNKNDYSEIPQYSAEKIYYSWHFILKTIDDKDWDDKIIDYLDYIIYTFGAFPQDYGEPLFLGSYFEILKELLKGIKEKKYQRKKQILIDHLESYHLENKKKSDTDFNILLSIYNQWYKSFPFDISIFKHLKDKFSKSLPLLEKTHYNKYLDITIGITKSKYLLINYLEYITRKLLTEINSLNLYEEGKLNDIENYRLEIIIKNRRLTLAQGYTNDSKSIDTRYRNILKAWLADEIEFVKELSTTLSNINVKRNNLFLDVLYACNKLQENKIFSNLDEDSRTKQILDIVEINYSTKDQTQIGYSASNKKAGSVDGVIIDQDKIEYFIEALNLKSLDKEYIKKHIHKLEENYDSKGLHNKFLIVYCNLAENKFEGFYQKYFTFVKDEFEFIYEKKEVQIIDSNYTNQRIMKSTHIREAINVNIYHILLKM